MPRSIDLTNTKDSTYQFEFENVILKSSPISIDLTHSDDEIEDFSPKVEETEEGTPKSKVSIKEKEGSPESKMSIVKVGEPETKTLINGEDGKPDSKSTVELSIGYPDPL